jgi:23S rRNA pseudouridine2605 synthase
MEQVRLNKYLAECGIASRRGADELISQGRIQVNNKSVRSLGLKINPATDKIQVDGELIKRERKVYLLMNKPAGVITSTKDERSRKTVIDLINTRERVFPIGRLDYNTTGVLLLTNDGEFANKLIHPRNNIERVYTAILDKDLSEKDKGKLLSGIIIAKKKSKFINLRFPVARNYKIVRVSTAEGRNHFVKNMFKSLGYHVMKLNRESIGEFTAEDLDPGSYRKLSEKEISDFKKNYTQ